MQRYGRLKPRAQPAARQRGVGQAGVLGRNGGVARQRIEALTGDGEAGGAQMPGDLRIIERSGHRAIENGGPVFQFHAHRSGSLSHGRQEVVQVAGLQVGAHPAGAREAQGAGKIDAR